MSRICIVTGGTGGHIYPALALAKIWQKCDEHAEFLFIGNDDRMEADLIPEQGFEFRSLHTSGMVGNPLKRARAVWQMLAARDKAKGYLKDFQADLVIGFGGYVSAPVMLAASALRIPVVIHEQNSIVGKANQLVMNKASAIITCYTKPEEVFPKDKIHYLGNPRATIAKEADFDEEYFKSLGLDPNKKTILIVMGSLGSSSVNELMKTALKDADKNLQFLYVCGKDNDQDLNLFNGQENIHVVPYVDTLKIYGKIDGMICRAGATTLAEVTALGIPSILIPSPYVASNHQFYNAKMLEEQGAADIIEEKNLNGKILQEHIQKVFSDPAKREEMKERALAMGKPNAAYDIIKLCESLMKEQ